MQRILIYALDEGSLIVNTNSTCPDIYSDESPWCIQRYLQTLGGYECVLIPRE